MKNDDYYDEDFCIEDFCEDVGPDNLLNELKDVAENLQTAIAGNEEQTQILRLNLIAVVFKTKKLKE